MAAFKNERITENIVRDTLYDIGYKDTENIIVEEQFSAYPIVQKCLKNASKSGNGVGKPEFIIRSADFPDFIIVIECKSDKRFHMSLDKNKYAEYAVDGVLNYAAYLSKQYNVIAIAVSGQEANDLAIDTFLWVKSENSYSSLVDKNNNEIKRILSFDKYVKSALFDHKIEKARFSSLISFSKDVHNYMRDYAKLSETEKPLLVSGILIALFNNAFELNYKLYDQRTELTSEMTKAIEREIEKADIPKAKKKNMIQPYSFINVHPELVKIDQISQETPLFRLITDIDQHVRPFIDVYHNFDVIGQFYGEFLRYTGGDGKGLGIVLTPKHITELFAKIANLTTENIVLDTCAGTGGFLISAMAEMVKKAKGDEGTIQNIKKNCLLGVEQQPNMYALAASNMILRGDGKANLYQGSCFDEAITKEITGKADIGFVNPPYSQKGVGLHELDFILHLLECVKTNGTVIAIVPITCAISPNPLKDSILKGHRLDAVMSMPEQLFHPLGVISCIMVFTAHVPHFQNEFHKTWFGYWRKDGFIKTKHKGRIDGGHWHDIQNKWLNAYFSKSEIDGFSILRRVEAQDEWCAEAYLETKYSELTEFDYMQVVKKYFLFKLNEE